MEILIENLDTIHAREINRIAKEWAETFVKKDRLKTHQLRNVFSAIEKMRTKAKSVEKGNEVYGEVEADLILLKPKIAYASGRLKSVRYSFFPFVEAAIDAVDQAEDKDKALRNFFALMESVVGYHKFFESGQN